MPAHIFGTRETLQFDIAPKDPESFAMRQVDIHAAGTHVTATDNGVYVPSFLFTLHRTLKSFRNPARFQPRADIFGDRGPVDIHRILADAPDPSPDPGDLPDLWAFLQFGDVALRVLSFLIPTAHGVYLSCETPSPETPQQPGIRVVEVSVEALARTMTQAFEAVAAEYEGDKSSVS